MLVLSPRDHQDRPHFSACLLHCSEEVASHGSMLGRLKNMINLGPVIYDMMGSVNILGVYMYYPGYISCRVLLHSYLSYRGVLACVKCKPYPAGIFEPVVDLRTNFQYQ